MIERKTFIPLKVEFGEKGTFKAVFATMNVVDSDGDLTLNGAFGIQEVPIGAYAHGSWYGELPVGKGTIHEEGDLAIVEGEFFLETSMGKDTYHMIKGMKELQQWSYALPEIDYEYREQDGESIRILKRIVVGEVSPCLIGSGIDTRTLGVKAGDQPGLKLLDHLVQVKEHVENLTKRVQAIKKMREEKGKNLSKVTSEQVKILADTLSDTVRELKLMEAVTPVVSEIQREFLAYQKILFEQQTQGEKSDE